MITEDNGLNSEQYDMRESLTLPGIVGNTDKTLQRVKTTFCFTQWLFRQYMVCGRAVG
jgi:hypothetical protein